MRLLDERPDSGSSTPEGKGPYRTPTRPAGWILLIGIGALCFFAYGPALDESFIADDFTNLGFVRALERPWFEFLLPTRAYSDPVTRSRYKPLYVYYYGAIEELFGEQAFAYHLLGLLFHVGTALLVSRLGLRLGLGPRAAAGAALLFALWRLHWQTVTWISASYRSLAAGLGLAALLALHGRRGAPSLALNAALYAAATLLNPELIMLSPQIVILYVALRSHLGARAEHVRRFAGASVGCAVVAVVLAAASALSARTFGEQPIALVPHIERALLFLVNVFVPFDAPLALRLALVAALAAAPLWRRDRIGLGLLGCVGVAALFWSLMPAYPLTPRYLYLASAFASLLLVRVAGAEVSAACSTLERRGRWARRGARALSRAPALGLVALLTLNTWLIRQRETVHYACLAQVGDQLMQVKQTSARRGVRAEVFIEPPSHLAKSDLAFFRQHIDFVALPGPETHTVRTDLTYCRRHLGAAFGELYWSLPWFADRF